jgi:hypothetical protein
MFNPLNEMKRKSAANIYFERPKLYLYFILLSISSPCICLVAQSPGWDWAASMGGASDNFCYSVAVDTVGTDDVYTTGWFSGTVDFDPGVGVYNLTSAGSLDIYISKLDHEGQLVWARTIGGDLFDQSWSMAIDPSGSGDIYLTGTFQGTVDFDPGNGIFNMTSAGGADIFITKLDRAGNFEWVRTFGGIYDDVGRSIAIDPAGNGEIVVTGSFQGTVDFDPAIGTFNITSNGNEDIFISKFDVAGDMVWVKAIGGTGFDHGYSIAIDPSGSGDVYTTGAFERTADFDPGPGKFNLKSFGNIDCFISKLNSSGNFVWAGNMGGTGSDAGGVSIAIDPGNGSVVSTGYFSGTVDFDPGAGIYNLSDGGVFIARLDGQGNFTWAKALTGIIYTGTDRSLALDQESGDVYLTGMFYQTVDFDPGVGVYNLTSVDLADIFISKLSQSGDFVWTNTVGAENSEMSNSLALNSSGEVVIAGYFDSPSVSFGQNTLINPETYAMDQYGNEYYYYSSDVFVAKMQMHPLSIDLVSFRASYDDILQHVNFEWITANEINNESFTIERSGDLINFNTILQVAGAGDSVKKLHYEASDANPKPGKNFYRLRQTDFDGKSTYSQIIAVQAAFDMPRISIYPNPVSDQMTIHFGTEKPAHIAVTLYSPSGNVVLSSNEENAGQNEVYNISRLIPSIYFVEISIDGQKFSQKIIKE